MKIVDVRQFIRFLTYEDENEQTIPRSVMRYRFPAMPVPINPTQLAAALGLTQQSIQGWYTSGLPETQGDKLANWYGFDEGPLRTSFDNDDLAAFKEMYRDHWEERLEKPVVGDGPLIEEIDFFDEILCALSLWLSQEKTTAPDGGDLWSISFGLRSQPSPTVIDGLQLVLKRVRVFLTVQDGKAIWHETYAAVYEPEGTKIKLKPIGSNVRPGRLIEANGGAHIETVDVPHDFYRVAGLKRGSVVCAWVAAHSKDIGLERRSETAEASVQVDSADEDTQRDPPYSFARLRANDTLSELTSAGQIRLLKIMEEMLRQQRMPSNRPRVGPGWVLLHWVEREHPYASDTSETAMESPDGTKQS